jgi:TRAP-type C4-dicarboxylate transport system permease small subunit
MAERILLILVRTCTVLGALALLIMMLGTDYDIIARLSINRPLRGIVELVEIMVLASAMLGLPEAFLRDEQIRIDLVDSFLPPPLLKAVKIFALLLTILFLAILSFNVYQPMLDAHLFGDIKADLGVPVYPLYGLILFSFCASILACIAALWRVFSAPMETVS